MRRPAVVRLVGHGSSDNAASYAVYAFGLLPGWTALRDSISLSVYYGADLDLSQSCVVALSQSGRTPDVVEYAERARAKGALTIAITNDPDSVLADVCEAVLPLAAGAEQAVAATKTYTTQIAALALLAGSTIEEGRRIATGIRATAELMRELLPELEPRVSELAMTLAYTGRMFVTSRGLEFATAREISLKLLETCRVAAEPLTATDLAHGPVAALDGLFPVWAIASNDASLEAVREAAARVRRRRRDAHRQRHGRRRARGRGSRPLRAHAAGRPAVAAPLRRSRPAPGLGARTGEGPRSRPARRIEQGHSRALARLG